MLGEVTRKVQTTAAAISRDVAVAHELNLAPVGPMSCLSERLGSPFQIRDRVGSSTCIRILQHQHLFERHSSKPETLYIQHKLAVAQFGRLLVWNRPRICTCLSCNRALRDSRYPRSTTIPLSTPYNPDTPSSERVLALSLKELLCCCSGAIALENECPFSSSAAPVQC